MGNECSKQNTQPTKGKEDKKRLHNAEKQARQHNANVGKFLKLKHGLMCAIMAITAHSNRLSVEMPAFGELFSRECQDKLKIEHYFNENHLEEYIPILAKQNFIDLDDLICDDDAEFKEKILTVLEEGIKKQIDKDQAELAKELLTKCGLAQFYEAMIDEGWDDPNDWGDLEDDDLKDMGFKKGHIKKFKKKLNTQALIGKRDNGVLKKICLKPKSWEKYQLEQVKATKQGLMVISPLLSEFFTKMYSGIKQSQEMLSNDTCISLNIRKEWKMDSLVQIYSDSIKKWLIPIDVTDTMLDKFHESPLTIRALTVATGFEDCCIQIVKTQAMIRQCALLAQEILKFKLTPEAEQLWKAIDDGISKCASEMDRISATYFSFCLRFKHSFNYYASLYQNNNDTSLFVALKCLKKDIADFYTFQKDFNRSVGKIDREVMKCIQNQPKKPLKIWSDNGALELNEQKSNNHKNNKQHGDNIKDNCDKNNKNINANYNGALSTQNTNVNVLNNLKASGGTVNTCAYNIGNMVASNNGNINLKKVQTKIRRDLDISDGGNVNASGGSIATNNINDKKTKKNKKKKKKKKKKQNEDFEENGNLNPDHRTKNNYDVSIQVIHNILKNVSIKNKVLNESNIHDYIDKSTTMQYNDGQTKVFTASNGTKFIIFNYDLNWKDNQIRYNVVELYKDSAAVKRQCKGKMIHKSMTHSQIEDKYQIKIPTNQLPASSRNNPAFKLSLYKMKEINSISINKIINNTTWGKIKINKRKENNGRSTYSVTPERFIQHLTDNVDVVSDNIKLFPFVECSFSHHCVEYMWLVSLKKDVNIGISFKIKPIIVTGIHLDKEYMLNENRLINLSENNKYLNNFQTNINDLKIGNPDEDENKYKSLKNDYKALQNDHKALQSDYDALPNDYEALKDELKQLKLQNVDHDNNVLCQSLNNNHKSLKNAFEYNFIHLQNIQNDVQKLQLKNGKLLKDVENYKQKNMNLQNSLHQQSTIAIQFQRCYNQLLSIYITQFQQYRNILTLSPIQNIPLQLQQINAPSHVPALYALPCISTDNIIYMPII